MSVPSPHPGPPRPSPHRLCILPSLLLNSPIPPIFSVDGLHLSPHLEALREPRAPTAYSEPHALGQTTPNVPTKGEVSSSPEESLESDFTKDRAGRLAEASSRKAATHRPVLDRTALWTQPLTSFNLLLRGPTEDAQHSVWWKHHEKLPESCSPLAWVPLPGQRRMPEASQPHRASLQGRALTSHEGDRPQGSPSLPFVSAYEHISSSEGKGSSL